MPPRLQQIGVLFLFPTAVYASGDPAVLLPIAGQLLMIAASVLAVAFGRPRFDKAIASAVVLALVVLTDIAVSDVPWRGNEIWLSLVSVAIPAVAWWLVARFLARRRKASAL